LRRELGSRWIIEYQELPLKDNVPRHREVHLRREQQEGGREQALSVIVRMSGFVRDVTGGKTEADVAAKDIADCLEKLEVLFPGIKEQLFDEQGDLHRFVDVFVNGDNVQHLQGLATQLVDGDEVSILPAFAGG